MALRTHDSLGGGADLRPGSQRGAPGFFHVAQDSSGVWRLFDPGAQLTFLKAVHRVVRRDADADSVVDLCPSAALRRWGFNAVGVKSDDSGPQDGLPELAEVGLSRAAPLIVSRGIRLPDVFSPEWPAGAASIATRQCAHRAQDAGLVGWVSDGDIAWGSDPTAPGLLQVCLSLEPSFAAYHAAWEFLLALHGGHIAGIARAWEVPVPNREIIRELTRCDTALMSRGYQRDEVRWLREFSGRYFQTASDAIRQVDPNHLRFGCCLEYGTPAAVYAQASYPAVDVVLWPWPEIASVSAAHGPVVADGVRWSERMWRSIAANHRRNPGLTHYERLFHRERVFLRRLSRHPSIVGYTWHQWNDSPGERPPFASGLVHETGAVALEHIELLADFNHHVDALRRSTLPRTVP